MNGKITMGLVLVAIAVSLAVPAVGQTVQSIMVATLAEPEDH